MAAMAEILNKERPDTIYCLFSSSGGDVESGVALYNFLRALPVELIMHNIGSVVSTANIIFLAGAVRYAAVHSSFLFHGITWNFPANTPQSKSQLSEILSGMESSESKFSGIITERSKLTADEVLALFCQGESKDPAFALSKGIIDEIKNPVIPAGANIYSFNLPS